MLKNMVKFSSEISDVIEDILLIYKNITTIKKNIKVGTFYRTPYLLDIALCLTPGNTGNHGNYFELRLLIKMSDFIQYSVFIE